MSRVIDEHRRYLRDHARVSAYAQALAEVVRPGDVVVDLASGTGVLGLLACRAGAARVYAIESDGIAGLARQIARANGFDDRIVGVRGHSTHVTLPEPADVVVCDQIGQFGFEAGVIEYFADARRRMLKPGGRLIPLRIDFWVAPVARPALWNRVRFWETPHGGLTFEPARAIAANTGYPTRMRSEHVIAAPARAGSVSLTAAVSLPLRLSADTTIDRPATLHGVAGWFAAQLSETVSITNSPLDPGRIQRRQVFFPIDRPVTVEPGDRVGITMVIRPGDLIVGWDVLVSRGGAEVQRFRHSTLRGMLLDPPDLRRTDPDYRPRLTARGEARLTVLRLCDGRRALADVERQVFEAHPDLFTDPAQAAAFVTEVVARYTDASDVIDDATGSCTT